MGRFWVICIGSLSGGVPCTLSGNTAALLRTLQRACQLTDATKAGLNDVQAVAPLWGFADLFLPHSNSQLKILVEAIESSGGKNPTLSHRLLIIRKLYKVLKLVLYHKNITICTDN